MTEEPCPVQFAYVYPEDSNEHRWWLLGFVRQLKGSRGSLHNHNVHASPHLLTKTQEDIESAAIANTTLKPFKISRGKGLGYIPASVNKAYGQNLKCHVQSTKYRIGQKFGGRKVWRKR